MMITKFLSDFQDIISSLTNIQLIKNVLEIKKKYQNIKQKGKSMLIFDAEYDVTTIVISVSVHKISW